MYLHLPGHKDQIEITPEKAKQFFDKAKNDKIPIGLFNNQCPFSNDAKLNSNIIGISIDTSDKTEKDNTKKWFGFDANATFPRVFGKDGIPYAESIDVIKGNDTYSKDNIKDFFKGANIEIDETNVDEWFDTQEKRKKLIAIRNQLQSEADAKNKDLSEGDNQRKINEKELNNFKQLMMNYDKNKESQDLNEFQKMEQELVKTLYNNGEYKTLSEEIGKIYSSVDANYTPKFDTSKVKNETLKNKREYINDLQQSWNTQVNKTRKIHGDKEILTNVDTERWNQYTASLDAYGKELQNTCHGNNPPPDDCAILEKKFNVAKKEAELNTAEIARQQKEYQDKQQAPEQAPAQEQAPEQAPAQEQEQEQPPEQEPVQPQEQAPANFNDTYDENTQKIEEYISAENAVNTDNSNDDTDYENKLKSEKANLVNQINEIDLEISSMNEMGENIQKKQNLIDRLNKIDNKLKQVIETEEQYKQVLDINTVTQQETADDADTTTTPADTTTTPADTTTTTSDTTPPPPSPPASANKTTSPSPTANKTTTGGKRATKKRRRTISKKCKKNAYKHRKTKRALNRRKGVK